MEVGGGKLGGGQGQGVKHPKPSVFYNWGG